MKESIDFLEKLNIKNEILVVGVSGGADSMTLLNILKLNNYNVVCAHVNHGLRLESEEEYKFVEKYCKDFNIPFEGFKINEYTNNKFTENEARKKRYDFFERVLKKYNTKYLLTAHHGDDLIETILMRIIRGSNINGYKGFSKISKYRDFNILRPLIFYTKKEIEEYVVNNNIPYVYDKSNESKKYTRNRIRLDVLPILKNENDNVHKKFLDFNSDMEDIQDYLKVEVDKIIKDNYCDGILNLDKFNKLHNVIKKSELETILFSLYNEDIGLINKNHIDNILSLIDSIGNKNIILPKNLHVNKEYNKLIFSFIKNNDVNEYKYILEDEVKIDNYGTIKFISDTFEKSNYVIKLNSSDIKLPLIVRNKLDSDVMFVKNLNGSKKVNKIFIDEKICKEVRYNYPVVTDSDNNILWLPGIKKSKFDCYNKDFYDIIIKYIKKGE